VNRLRLGAVVLALCAAPAPGSPETEADAEARRVAHDMGLVARPELTRWIAEIGARIARAAGRSPGSFRFAVVDQGEPNAFALPDGQIFVSRGLLELAQSEAELAGVLGHEIVHVLARHAAARQQTAERAVNPLMLPGIVLGTVLGSRVGEATTAPFRAFSAPYVAAYSRDQERESDRTGQKLAAAAGYDPAALAHFLRRLHRFERERFGHSRLPGYLDSHPGTSERAGQMAADAGLIEWKRVVPIAATPAAYLERIDGLVVGPRAGEGEFRGERFLHPDLDFHIRFPTDWRLVNADHAVGAISPDRRAQIFLSPPEPGDSARSVAERFLAEQAPRLRLDVYDPRELQLPCCRSYRIEAAARTPVGPVVSQVTWIEDRGRVYRLTGIAPQGVGQKYLGRAQNTARTFRPLTPEERASIRERRLRRAEAREGESLAELAARSGNALGLQLLAVANDLDPRAPLRAGTLVKIARAEPYAP
jgi:predicted Zn-dependent protease